MNEWPEMVNCENCDPEAVSGNGVYFKSQDACPVCGHKNVKQSKIVKQSVRSPLEIRFLAEWKRFAPDYDMPESEYRFHPERRWRFDFAWPTDLVACEMEGGVYAQGRHVRPQGFINDLEKYNAATELGWKVFRYETVKSEYLEQIKRNLD